MNIWMREQSLNSVSRRFETTSNHGFPSVSVPYMDRNDRLSCVCGASRNDVPQQLWKVTDKEADLIYPKYYYKCPHCATYSAVNLYFPVEKYEEMPLEAMHIGEMKRQLNRTRVNWLKARVSFPGDLTLFDLGAGEGCFVHEFTDATPHARAYAVDGDARLQVRFYSQNERVIFIGKPIEVFLQEIGGDHSFPRAHVIVMTDVLEHVLSPEDLLQDLTRVLAPGGFAYLTVPNACTFQYPAPVPVPAEGVDWAHANRTCQHLWMMQPEVFRNIVSKHFHIVDETQALETDIRRDSVYSTILAQKIG